MSQVKFCFSAGTGDISYEVVSLHSQRLESPVNPGRFSEYSFVDFVKMGIPLVVLVGVITVWLAPIFFPF